MQVCKANGRGCWRTSRRQHDGEAIGPENKQMETCGGQERERQAVLSTIRLHSGKCKTQVGGVRMTKRRIKAKS